MASKHEMAEKTLIFRNKNQGPVHEPPFAAEQTVSTKPGDAGVPVISAKVAKLQPEASVIESHAADSGAGGVRPFTAVAITA